MLDFDTVTKKHSETLIRQIVETWERYNHICQEPRSLEDRWARFIQETNDNSAPLTQATSA
ncbi:MAG: hypothetical protein FWF24_00985 [Alphaproteobacteria bacterium]|nr:hypothetical protein [Alphaproteobacteria bacterium]